MTNKAGLIALAGRPNAGKSTFLNFILGEKVSIVSDKPQTTRNRILGVYHDEGLQIGFLDLPGIHKPKFQLNQRMMKAVQRALADVDLIFHFIDLSIPVGSGDQFAHEYLKRAGKPVILVPNKMDLVNKTKVLAKLQQLSERFDPEALVPVSAKTGDNLSRLIETASAYMPEGERLFEEDTLTDQPLRFMAQEFIREKLLHYTRDEIPHAVAVTLESYEQNEDDTISIGAVIWVEKTSQRRIILGTQGQMIAKITRGARRSLKGLLGKPVYLELFVKVEQNWRDKDSFVTDLEF